MASGDSYSRNKRWYISHRFRLYWLITEAMAELAAIVRYSLAPAVRADSRSPIKSDRIHTSVRLRNTVISPLFFMISTPLLTAC